MLPSPRRLLIVSLCIALLALRFGGAHLHLCFDGSEAPSALHFADAGLHHADAGQGHADKRSLSGDGAHHDDVEVSIASDAIAKLSSSLDVPTLAVLLIAALLLFCQGRTPAPSVPSRLRLPRSPLHLRPPLRGPPRHSFA
ncbi:hypothetical protein [Nevskia sp.]|uniref:hypothetical protein n=1 Tax=Nevskia sp. TaxID=1929292 RepID=UPI0025FF32B2|nr:hypothetical protein [Nevskia sp.]